MRTVRTSDGVDLALHRSGSPEGPLLVLSHGSATDSRCFLPLLPLLRAYDVVRYDRRGHGGSTGGPDAEVEREVDDLQELLVHLERPALVLGYSYGATVALRGLTTRTLPVRGAVLYEPPLGLPALLDPLAEVVALADAGRHDAAVAHFVGRAFRLSDGVLAAMRRDPGWQTSVALMPTMPSVLAGLRASALPEPAPAAPPVRVLVAEAGGNPAFREIAEHLCRVLPDADLATVPGLPHFAMATEPAAFIAAADAHLRRCLG